MGGTSYIFPNWRFSIKQKRGVASALTQKDTYWRSPIFPPGSQESPQGAGRLCSDLTLASYPASISAVPFQSQTAAPRITALASGYLPGRGRGARLWRTSPSTRSQVTARDAARLGCSRRTECLAAGNRSAVSQTAQPKFRKPARMQPSSSFKRIPSAIISIPVGHLLVF